MTLSCRSSWWRCWWSTVVFRKLLSGHWDTTSPEIVFPVGYGKRSRVYRLIYSESDKIYINISYVITYYYFYPWTVNLEHKFCSPHPFFTHCMSLCCHLFSHGFSKHFELNYLFDCLILWTKILVCCFYYLLFFKSLSVFLMMLFILSHSALFDFVYFFFFFLLLSLF